MNKHFIKLCALVALCTPIYGCLDSSLNDDPDKVHVSRLAQDNLYGTYLTTLQRNVVAEDQNDFQLTEDLFGNMYAGYYAGTQSWRVDIMPLLMCSPMAGKTALSRWLTPR